MTIEWHYSLSDKMKLRDQVREECNRLGAWDSLTRVSVTLDLAAALAQQAQPEMPTYEQIWKAVSRALCKRESFGASHSDYVTQAVIALLPKNP